MPLVNDDFYDPFGPGKINALRRYQDAVFSETGVRNSHPMDVIARFITDESQPLYHRAKMALDAMKYMEPQLRSIEVSLPNESGIKRGLTINAMGQETLSGPEPNSAPV